MKLSIFSLKTETLLEFLRLGSKLFHLKIADETFEKVVLCFNKGNIAHSSCSIWCTSNRNEIKSYFGCSFLKTL